MVIRGFGPPQLDGASARQGDVGDEPQVSAFSGFRDFGGDTGLRSDAT